VAEVVLSKLTRRYEGAGASAAVRAIDLTIASGEVLVLVGPSGCGKSTTLRMVAGLEQPDGGEIRIDGRPMNGVPPQDRDVAMVFQGYALYPHMKVREILAFPLRMRGIDATTQRRKVDEAAAMLGLGKLLDRRPGELSGGERQRVAMGRAIVRSPKVFLFDEPLSNLDAALRAELRVELSSLVRELRTTALYVTHDYVEAMTIGDRIAVMRGGRLEQVGSPREVYGRPATSFVAGFLGTPPMNVVEIARDGAEILVAGARMPAADVDPRATLVGVRPEHLRLDGLGGEPALRIEATVAAVEPLGAESHLSLEASGARLRARIAGIDAPERGASIVAHIAPRDLHWFDGEGRRIG
jgi:multiple sugar transport system ATP-binding protein